MKIRANAKNRYHNMNHEQMQKHKEYQNIYRAKKKQELENSKKEQGDFDKKTVLTPEKT